MRLIRKIHNILHPKLGRIYMLHSISSAEYLETLVERCRRDGFKPVSIDEAVESLKNAHHSQFTIDSLVLISETRCSQPSTHNSPFSCFSFDDGYLDTYTIAFPTMVKLGVPFCVYMTKDFYRGAAQPAWDLTAQMMDIEQMQEMSGNPLCTIGVHTCSHPHLSTLTADDQRHEIAECKADLEKLLGREVRHLAYPHGDYNQTTVEIASELGFITAVTTSGRHVRSDSKLLELDRVFA